MPNKKETIELLGSKIRELRKERGLTVAGLAEKVDVSKSYLSHIEIGSVDNPTIQVISRIANALNVELKDLFSTQNEEKQRPPITLGHPSNLDDSSDETPTNIRRYKRVFSLLEEVLTDESIPQQARRDLAEEIISLIKWAKKWGN